MRNLHRSIAARLALGYGVLVVVSISIVCAVFYFGTIGVLDRSVDRKLTLLSERLAVLYEQGGSSRTTAEIAHLLTDRTDSDTEIFLLVDADGRRVAGNLSSWPDVGSPVGHLLHRDVTREGRRVPARMLIRELAGGARLFVGRDMEEGKSIRSLVLRSLAYGGGAAILLVVAGAWLFRRQLEARIGQIRRTAGEIEAGDLSRRIPVSSEDEFGLLSRDINRMLDRIEHLMEGVRHVSNAIAHDLRTPLGRIRNKLDGALRQQQGVAGYESAAQAAIDDIDDLTRVFDKLLQIAAAESGMRPENFDDIDLHQIGADIVEMYEATADEQGVLLVQMYGDGVPARGDRNLLGSALASLVDNAIKYAGPGATVEVSAGSDAHGNWLAVRDNGPGVPTEELPKLTQRFYRLDKSRHLPGNGLGLSIVAAIAALHGGSLEIEDAAPGLRVQLRLRR
ncbi:MULTISPECIES: cell wall metabolism sensor histidine kinase WalK [unclassified Janthinobacterium]|uniref:sensor histidine kinase n=1 Tax=unclassified Janthinobacterium TaxID=2610881 RepID=UPI001E333AB7|nr:MULTISPECIES: HAMP domain-containing sensor histidine kinase [unclassified Janthinobacterium]MCC7645289.1 HAMP domain-containing histidine kinase [Janthinobacterium sp. EB271-G4-3-1]MCC7690345.1 HAMP domain-containing histidine kinase [Janthinobacterium sp. EB271-G4-3-2]